MPELEALAGLARPWADLYAESVAISTGVEFAHLAGLLVAGGLALAFDRAALRLAGGRGTGRGAFATELSAVHGPVLAALVFVILSGLALVAADLDAFLRAPVFWVKMAVFVLLLANGAVIRGIGRRLETDPRDADLWRRLGRGSWRSVGLWLLALLLGVLLTGTA